MPESATEATLQQAKPSSSLKLRVLTALVMAPVMIALIALLPPAGLWWFCAGLIGTAAYEWLPLAGFTQRPSRVIAGLSLAAIIGLLFSHLSVAVALHIGTSGLLVWAIAAAWLSNSSWGRLTSTSNRLVKLMIGAVILSIAAACLGLLFSVEQGRYWFFLLLLIIWAADIGAYFTGKSFGKHKLAPVVSPNKTWEGVGGGLLLVSLVCLLAGQLWLKLDGAQQLLLVVLGLSTAAVSIIGDLFISMLKRHVGLKDAGRVFPGHGGVLDRFDSLLAAAPTFLAGKVLLGL